MLFVYWSKFTRDMCKILLIFELLVIPTKRVCHYHVCQIYVTPILQYALQLRDDCSIYLCALNID